MKNNRDHLTEVQELCTGAAPEFVAGSIHGLREWFLYDGSYTQYEYTVTEPGHPELIGHFGQSWVATQTSEATCQALPVIRTEEVPIEKGTDHEEAEYNIRQHASDWFDEFFSENTLLNPSTATAYLAFSAQGPGNSQYVRGDTYRSIDWLLDDPFSDHRSIQIPMNFRRAIAKGLGVAVLKIRADRKEHRPGHPDCTCGIYAYHDLLSLKPTPRAFPTAVFGLVNAYGHVTVGTKGFRAEKADVVALTLPAPYSSRPRSMQESLDSLVDSWQDHGITLVPTLEDLLIFAERGGYLEKPEDLQQETG
jgi:hypothetical protein